MNTPVDFPTAKLLKEKGFDISTNHYYEHSLTEQYNEEDGYSGPFGWKKGETNYQSGYHQNNSKYDSSNDAWYMCSAPTISQVIMWLYEKHGIWVYPVLFINIKKFAINIDKIEPKFQWQLELYSSPTEAYEAGIKYVLENLI